MKKFFIIQINNVNKCFTNWGKLVMSNKSLFFVAAGVLFLGIYLRLYHIEFGLPHSFYADEPEIAELAIKYTYEIKNIIRNNDYYKLIPISYVYGTFPAYMNTFFTMLFSKSSNLLGYGFDKMSIYVFLRVINALLSLTIPAVISLLSYKLFKNKELALATGILLLLNWKFIVHAHYINADITQAILLTLSFLAFQKYLQQKADTKFTVLTGVFYGLAVGTKITALISLPLYYYVFLKNRDTRGLLAFTFIVFGAFIISNPFSVVFATDFAFRIYTMFTKEAGMVFDSVDYNPLKYIQALTFMLSPLVMITSLYGIFKITRRNPSESRNKYFHVFLIGNIIIYLLFFSLQNRRVDRWLLPILPIATMYATYGICKLKQVLNKSVFVAFTLIILTNYLYFPVLLTKQFQTNTPKSAAYIWMRDNIDPSLNKLVYTEEGLDPMNKLLGVLVFKYQVYTDEAAQFFIPENPDGYDYVVISSRPMENYKRSAVKNSYPFYYEKWNTFENKLQDENKFKLIKQFVLPKPNLIPLSDVFIYENLQPITHP